MDPTYKLKPQLRIKKTTNIYLDETVTLIQYIKLTSALLYVMTMCNYMTSYTRCIMTTISISINQLNVHKSFETIEKQRLSFHGKIIDP